MPAQEINPFTALTGIWSHIDWTYNMYIAKTYINKSNVTYVSMATKYPIIKHRAFFKTLTAAISPIYTWQLLMKLRMAIPVLHAYFVWQPIKHRSKVKVIKNSKSTFWDLTFEPDVVEISGWLNVSNEKNTFQNDPEPPWHTTYRFCVTWRHIKHTIFACFLNSSILYWLISKLVHTLIGPILCTLQKSIDQNNVTFFHGNQIPNFKA